MFTVNPNRVFSGSPITLNQLLQQKEDRAARQNILLHTPCQSLISFTLNIPGPIKQFPMAMQAFSEGVSQIRSFLGPHILCEQIIHPNTGSEALFSLSLSATYVKRIAISIEEEHPLGRLFDIDAIDGEGRFISREELSFPPRPCLICGKNAKACGRSASHTLPILQEYVSNLLTAYFRDQYAEHVSIQATRALLYEVSVTPKPGLVDRNNSGSHKDMDFFTFLDSSVTLSPWFYRMFCAGWDNSYVDSNQLFIKLRTIGRQAEKAMLQSTTGVNTHKGAIFSMGILCGALGSLSATHEVPLLISDVLDMCKVLGQNALKDFERETSMITNGVSCYRSWGIPGARGEAANGFPTVAQIGLPTLERWLDSGCSLNDASALTLLAIIASVQDTNMIRRAGIEAAEFRREEASNLLLNIAPEEILPYLARLDNEYIRENLSPGGCADLLSTSLFLLFLHRKSLIKYA